MSESSLNFEKDLSIDAERLVARTFIGRIEWEMIVIGLGQFVVWLRSAFETCDHSGADHNRHAIPCARVLLFGPEWNRRSACHEGHPSHIALIA